MDIELAEDLSCVEEVLVLENPKSQVVLVWCCTVKLGTGLDRSRGPLGQNGCMQRGYPNVLLCIPGYQGQVQDQRQPVAIDQEQYGQESVDAGFGNDVHVEAVAEVDGVDVVAFQVRVHDGEEDLQEEVDGIEKDSEQEQPVARQERHVSEVLQ